MVLSRTLVGVCTFAISLVCIIGVFASQKDWSACDVCIGAVEELQDQLEKTWTYARVKGSPYRERVKSELHLIEVMESTCEEYSSNHKVNPIAKEHGVVL